jgi:ADP-heptose:LPS heptosyltransferase
MLHAADLHRIPSVGIFGPTDPQKWGVRFASHEHIVCENLDDLNEEIVLHSLLNLASINH